MIDETIRIDSRQAEASLSRLASTAREAAGALGVSGVGGAVGNLGGAFLGLAGAGGPLGAVTLGLGVATAGAGAMVRAMFDLARSAAENAKEMRALGLVTQQEADAAEAAGAAIREQETASKALQVTIAAGLSPAVSELSGILTDGTRIVQDYARWLGDGSTTGSLTWAAIKTVTGLSGVITAIDAVRALTPRTAQPLDTTAADAEAAARRQALADAEGELLKARLAGADLDEKERLQVAAKEAEIRTLTATLLDETAATWERERASTLLAAREEELRQIRAAAERERATQSEAEVQRLTREAEAARRLAEARGAAGLRNVGLIGAQDMAILASGNTVSGIGGRANAAAEPIRGAGADTSALGSLNAGEGTRLQQMAEAHAQHAAQIRGVWTQTASTVAGAIDMMGGVFARSVAAQKVFAMTSIAINTAIATMQALMSPPGPPYTIPLAVAVGAFGAVQLAAAASGKMAGGGGFGGGMGSASTTPAMPSWAQYEPGSQAGQGEQGGPGWIGRRDSRREVTIRTVGGFANVRDLVDEINRTGGAMRLRLGGA